MKKTLTLICEARLMTEAQGKSGKIEATITTWGAREGADGRRFNYQPEGFMDWAESFAADGKPMPMFVNHNADAVPVGEWNSVEFTKEGMVAQGRIFTNTTAGKDIYTVMQESPNMFGGVSVAAYADEYQMVNANNEPDQSEEAYFQITKGGLREVSIVMYPNNPEANVSRLEYFRPDGSADLKVFEQALRDAGLDKKDAKLAASVIKGIVEKRDVTPVAVETESEVRDVLSDAANDEILAALERRELLKSLDKRLKG